MDRLDMPETGPADFDHAHRAVVSLVWNLPKLPGQDSNLQPFTRTELARPFNYFAVQITTAGLFSARILFCRFRF
jgi:hypothetical protein